MRVGNEQTETIAVESEDPRSVAALVRRLGFPLRPNVSMPAGSSSSRDAAPRGTP